MEFEVQQTRAMIAKAMNYCSRKETCTAAVREKLAGWGCPEDKVDAVIDELIGQRFLDDRRFAAAYVNDKLRFSRWGRVKIRYMLRAQGVAADIADDALSAIDEEQYLKIVKDELQKKQKGMGKLTPEAKAKLYRFAASRGFEGEAVRRALADATVP